MRFIPATFMQSGECVKAYSNGSASGSFVSGSDVFYYHEWKLSNRDVSETFELEVLSGFTSKARAVLIAGGGGGGWDGQYNSGAGGGGGAGQVIDRHNIILYPTSVPYQIRVGHGGLPADADNPNPTFRTYNGGDGDYTEILGGVLNIRAEGGDGGYGIGNTPSSLNYDGGNSGNGFLGGVSAGRYGGGGGGATSDGGPGQDGPSQNYTGDGGTGIIINLPYNSPTWGDTSKGVGGGGAGYAEDIGESITNGTAVDGGGAGTVDGERYTGGGGGGGRDFPATPPAGIGTEGGDGVLIIYYPITNCIYHGVTSGSFNYSSDAEQACSTSNTDDLFYLVSDGLNTGSVLYQDILLQYPASSSYYEINNSIYFVSESNGIITQINECSTVLQLHTGSTDLEACSSTITDTFYISGSVTNGNILYADFFLTTVANDGYYREDNSQNVFQLTSGVISNITSCNITGTNWRFTCPSGASTGCAYSYVNPLDVTITGNIGPSGQLTVCVKNGTTPTISPGGKTNLGTTCTVPAP